MITALFRRVNIFGLEKKGKGVWILDLPSKRSTLPNLNLKWLRHHSSRGQTLSYSVNV